MNASQAVPGPAEAERKARHHRWRGYKDLLARRVIGLGGAAVLVAVTTIFFYLLYVVFPLFLPAGSSVSELGHFAPAAGDSTLGLALEEQREVAMHLDREGQLRFFHLPDLQLLETVDLRADGPDPSLFAVANQGEGLAVVAFADGSVRLLQPSYRTVFDRGVASRQIVPGLEWPYGEAAFSLAPGETPRLLAVSADEAGMTVALAGSEQVHLLVGSLSQDLLSGESRLETATHSLAPGFEPTAMTVAGGGRTLYLGDATGAIHSYAIPGLVKLGQVQASSAALTSMTMLLGGASVLAGDAEGRVVQLFPVRDQDQQPQLTRIREFHVQTAAIVRLLPEARRRGFAALDESGQLGIYHSTSGRHLLSLDLGQIPAAGLALAPRADGLLALDAAGGTRLFRVENQYPEVSWSTLWRKVWYENYAQPEFVWQSSSGSNDFEPKFSLAPLAFGTLKAALFAMLFAVPLALAGAAYTAYFMAPGMRRTVKPLIEIMAAMPTVILGFLAGLWFAPILEDNLARVLAVLLLLPPGVLLVAWLWHRLAGDLRSQRAQGWEPVVLIPALVLLVWLAMRLAGPLEAWCFDGDLRTWLSQVAGIDYDQRNALVVGIAMGFAVIPIMFSIAEDAVFGVPQSLTEGSLALGATRWQCLVRVVLPTASPGIFSGLMIGLGRAVGETMIVLMAAGNTPIMEWNPFQGMRTLAANIAVEMPESEWNGSHYRILFLAALVLFLFTFVLNTAAEIVRQRLRRRYSQC